MSNSIAQLYVEFAAKGLDKVRKGLDALKEQMKDSQRHSQALRLRLSELAQIEKRNKGLTIREKQERLQIQKSLFQQQRIQHNLLRSQDKINKHLRDRSEILTKQKEKINKIGDAFGAINDMAGKARNVFSFVGAGVMGLLSQADPVRFKMLGVSISILALHMGRIFIPILKDAIGFIDRLSSRFKNMTDEQRQRIVGALMPAWKMVTGAIENVVELFTNPERFERFWDGIKVGAEAVGTVLSNFISTVKKWWQWLIGKLPEWKKQIIEIAEWIGKIAGTIYAWAPAIAIITGIVKSAQGLNAILSLLGGSGGTVRLLGAGLQALVTPAGLATTAISTLAGVALTMAYNFGKAKREAEDLAKRVRDLKESGGAGQGFNYGAKEAAAREASENVAVSGPNTGRANFMFEHRFLSDVERLDAKIEAKKLQREGYNKENAEKIAMRRAMAKHRRDAIANILQTKGMKEQQAKAVAGRVTSGPSVSGSIGASRPLTAGEQAELRSRINEELEVEQKREHAKKSAASARSQAEKAEADRQKAEADKKRPKPTTEEWHGAINRARGALGALAGNAINAIFLGGKKPWRGEQSHKEVMASLNAQGGGGKMLAGQPKGQQPPQGSEFAPLMPGRKPELLDVMEVWKRAQTADNNNPMLRYQKELLNESKGIRDALDKIQENTEKEQGPRGLRR